MASSRCRGHVLRLAPPGRAPVEVLAADSFGARLLGLAFLSALPLDGLMLTRCSGVHTVGMRFAIDVVFLELRSLEVLDICSGLSPGRRAGVSLRALGLRRRDVAALELASGRAGALGLRVGMTLQACPRFDCR